MALHGTMVAPLFRLYLAISADGFIATMDGEVDWLDPYPAQDFGFDAFLAGIGTIVMGRTSYEQTLRFGPWPFGAKRTIVMTSRPLVSPPARIERRHGDAAAVAAELRAGGTGDVWLFGGANVARQFLDAGIVDRIELFVVPLLLGSGIRLFERLDRGVALQLNELKEHAKGVVQVTYSVVR